MREKELEAYLRREVEKLGGRFPKWVSPGNNGVPDRIALLPSTYDPENHEYIWFVELKAPGGRLRPEQERWREWLQANALNYILIDSKEAADKWLSNIRRGLGKS